MAAPCHDQFNVDTVTKHTCVAPRHVTSTYGLGRNIFVSSFSLIFDHTCLCTYKANNSTKQLTDPASDIKILVMNVTYVKLWISNQVYMILSPIKYDNNNSNNFILH